jgi:aspartokinase-like uncharacterized kinase
MRIIQYKYYGREGQKEAKELDVVKVGGSLLEHARVVMAQLRAYDVLVVPGGGVFVDTVRRVQRETGIEDSAAHKMAILAMEEYGLLLSDVSGIPAYESLEDVQTPGIFLPRELLKTDDHLEPSWDVTSDTIACHIARLAHADRFIILTDVDGIFVDDSMVDEISADELEGLGETCVDRVLPGYLKKHKMDCQVVNGKDRRAVERALEGEDAGTTVRGKQPLP